MEKVCEPREDHHPMKQSPHWKTTYIPMALHGDAVPLIKMGKAWTTSFDATSITLNENVHLEDRDLGIFQNLNSEPTYAFTSSVAGNIPTRFALHFGMSVTGVEDAGSNVGIYSSGKHVIVLLSGMSAGTIDVFDMAGRMVHTRHIKLERTTIDLSTASGIYLVRVETANGTVTRKISIQ